MTITHKLLPLLHRARARAVFPVELVRLEGRPVLVAGAGPDAAPRIEALLDTGAEVHVVARSVSEHVAALFPRLRSLERRDAVPVDVLGKRLVIAATGDAEANRELALFARAHGVLAHAVDDLDASDFFLPAVIRRGAIRFTIGTNGASPTIAAQLRRVFEALIPASVGALGALFVRLRRRGHRGLESRQRLLEVLTDETLIRLVDRGYLSAAEERLSTLLAEAEEVFPDGTVAVVGAGPGPVTVRRTAFVTSSTHQVQRGHPRAGPRNRPADRVPD